jgi:hypothetical protein
MEFDKSVTLVMTIGNIAQTATELKSAPAEFWLTPNFPFYLLSPFFKK